MRRTYTDAGRLWYARDGDGHHEDDNARVEDRRDLVPAFVVAVGNHHVDGHYADGDHVADNHVARARRCEAQSVNVLGAYVGDQRGVGDEEERVADVVRQNMSR